MRGELAVARDEHARAAQAWREVEKLHPPSAELREEVEDPRGARQEWIMGDARVWVLPGSSFDAERRQALLSGWRSNRYRERGFDLPPYNYKRRVEDLADRLAKIERKLGAMLF